jgi:hypothetical protein
MLRHDIAKVEQRMQEHHSYDAIAFAQRDMFWRVFIILMVLWFVG